MESSSLPRSSLYMTGLPRTYPTIHRGSERTSYKEKNGGYEKLEAHARLFMVPGMQHCLGGAGPNAFDTLSALENWVEKGVAPDGIPAKHSANNVVDRTM